MKRTPHELNKSKARAAAMANATRGRARVIDSKKVYNRNKDKKNVRKLLND